MTVGGQVPAIGTQNRQRLMTGGRPARVAVSAGGSGFAPSHDDDTALSLLSGFELLQNDVPIKLPLSAQRLIAFLALHRRPLLRIYVSGVLWIDHSQDAANANLRTTLWRLRQQSRLIDATSSHVALGSDVRVDLDTLDARASQVLTGNSALDGDQLGELLAAGELLPDWYDDWVVIERERFRQRRLHALERLCDLLAQQGRYALAVEAGLTAISGEPLRESTHQAVMRAHLAEGNRYEARRQYELCRRLLHEQLGMEPSPATELIRSRC